MTDQRFPITGGCLCSTVHYSLLAPAKQVEYCHCSMCRESHGALFASLTLVAKQSLRIDSGKESLRSHLSSPTIHRQLCGNCGCPLFLDMDDIEEESYFFAATLDGGVHSGHPIQRECHNWVSSTAQWEVIADDVPKFETEPEGVGWEDTPVAPIVLGGPE
jgi:hypothetical protein